ncbi:MAG: hypothetical protein IIY93_06025 [Clostridia bacterium]|nr:hypothetical protein [Clostridia bacterium]
MKQWKAVIAALVAAALLMLTACNDAVTPEQAIKSFNVKMNDCNYKGAFAYVSEYDGLSFDKGDQDGTRKIVDAVSRTLAITILDIQTSGATGAARLNVKTVDLRRIYSEAAAKVTNGYVDDVLKGAKISAEEMREALVSEIVRESATNDADRVETECQVNLRREKDHWYIILDSTSFNIMMGYINEANAMVENGDFSSVTPTNTPTQVSGSDVSSETGGESGESSVTFND